MNTLNIKDLSVTEELDRRAMSAVRGGFMTFGPLIDLSKTDISNSALQMTSQSQNTMANTGVNAAWAKKISATVTPQQDSSNSNTVNIGSGSHAPVLLG
jgi:hypothetical protein